MKFCNQTLVKVVLLLLAVGAIPLRLCAQYVITNNDVYRAGNSASVFELTGSSLKEIAALNTTGWGIGGGFFGTSAQAIATVGSRVCVFIADPGSDDIAAFTATATSASLVGNFNDPTGSGAYSGIALAVHGSTLYAGYSASVNIGVWAINPNCSLTVANSAANTPSWAPVDNLAVSPDGKTLVVTYGYQNADTFAISGTTLTEKGPFATKGYTAGIDITKDSKLAVFGDFSCCYTEFEFLHINSDSTLGVSDFYNESQGGQDSNNVWLSPDQTRLFVSNNVSLSVTTLIFDEFGSPGEKVLFDCVTPLHNPGTLLYAGGIATRGSASEGGYLYVTEVGNPASIAVLQIPQGGCPAEVSGSPFINTAGSSQWPVTLAVYPPRAF